MQWCYPHFENNTWKIKEMIGKWSPGFELGWERPLLVTLTSQNRKYNLVFVRNLTFHILISCRPIHVSNYKNTNMTLICKESKEKQAIRAPTRIPTRLSTIPLSLTPAHKIANKNKIDQFITVSNVSISNYRFSDPGHDYRRFNQYLGSLVILKVRST